MTTLRIGPGRRKCLSEVGIAECEQNNQGCTYINAYCRENGRFSVETPPPGFHIKVTIGSAAYAQNPMTWGRWKRPASEGESCQMQVIITVALFQCIFQTFWILLTFCPGEVRQAEPHQSLGNQGKLTDVRHSGITSHFQPKEKTMKIQISCFAIKLCLEYWIIILGRWSGKVRKLSERKNRVFSDGESWERTKKAELNPRSRKLRGHWRGRIGGEPCMTPRTSKSFFLDPCFAYRTFSPQ